MDMRDTPIDKRSIQNFLSTFEARTQALYDIYFVIDSDRVIAIIIALCKAI